MDETLARPVSVLTFAPGFPRIPQVVTAARAASRLTDPRLAQVFDVEDGEQPFVVLEWVGGETLADMLADGPLESAQACALIADAARAVAGAHAAGQVHLLLTPDALRWTRGSGVKITGLGIDAALAGEGMVGAAAGDPTAADTVGLAALLYAGLTGYWPGESQTALPPAPESDGVVCTPRQVTADVSPTIDAVVCRALLQRGGRHGAPIMSPGEFADALADVAPPVPLPEPAPLGTFEPPRYPGHNGYGGYQGGYPPNPDDPANWALPERGRGGTAPYRGPYPGEGPGRGPRDSRDGRGGASRVAISVVVVLVIAALVATALVISNSLGNSGSNKAGGGTPATNPSSAPKASTVLKPVGDSTFNIYGNDSEDEQDAPLAIDNSLKTAWATDYYKGRPNFGGLKPGTGLLLDMGQAVKLSQVEVLFGTQCCTTAEIYVGNSNAMSQTALSNFTKVSPSATVSGDHVFAANSSATGRYVLIWITSLPPMQGNPSQYQALIYNIVVHGTPASGTG